ncbi:MAG: SulP family inorganic anion transporter [Anaerolineae bacterium]
MMLAKAVDSLKPLTRYVPVLDWGRAYQRAWLRDDLVSGVVVGAVMVPVAMAYAQMAGVPPQAGLYSAIVGMALYAFLATSRHLKISTSSTMSIMSIAVVAPLAGGDATKFMALTSALAITVGIIMVMLGLAKLGFISDFLAKSVMTGYIFGVALIIAMSQLPKVFGVPAGEGSVFQQFAQLIANLPQTNPYALALGAGTVALILIIKRYKPIIPGALVALILGTLIAGVFNLNALYGVAVVGEIPTGMPSPQIPRIDPQDLIYLIGGAAGIVFLAVGETLGTARTFAAKYHYEVNPDQELLAMGAANIGSGLFQGITIDMSLSNTASAEAAGERTQLSSLVSSLTILAVVLFLAPLLHNLPSAVLGGIVLSSILGLFNFKEFKRYYAQRRTDFILACTALIGVAASDVMTGLILAVLLSLVMLLYRASRPYIAILGKRTSGEFGDHERHADAVPVPGLVILRLDAPLYFFNANVARTQILAQITGAVPPKAILLDLGATADLDIGTSDMLSDLSADLQTSGVDLLMAEVRSSVRDRMQRTGLLESVGEDHLYASIAAAVEAFLRLSARAEASRMSAETVLAPPNSEPTGAAQV